MSESFLHAKDSFYKKEIFLNRSQRDFLEKKNLKKINFFLEIFYLKIKFITQVAYNFLATTSYKNLDYFIKIVKKAFKKIY